MLGAQKFFGKAAESAIFRDVIPAPFPLGGLPLWDLATIPVALLGCISLSHPSLLYTILHSVCYSIQISGWWYLTGGRAFFIFSPQGTQSVAVSGTNVRKAYKGHECSALPLAFLTDDWPHASKKGRERETDKEAGVGGRVGGGIQTNIKKNEKIFISKYLKITIQSDWEHRCEWKQMLSSIFYVPGTLLDSFWYITSFHHHKTVNGCAYLLFTARKLRVRD